MSAWRNIIPVLLILLLLTACSSDQENVSNPDQAQSNTEATTPAAAEGNPKTATPPAVEGKPGTASPAAAEGDVGDDTPLEWPTELMGPIPAASGGVITSIDRGDSFYGEGGPEYITVVSLRGMDLSDCQAYIANLQALGFLYDVTEQETEAEIIYSGSLESGEAGVTFKYDFEYDTGFVSYNPQLDADTSGPSSDY
jgi:hypothetical protein